MPGKMIYPGHGQTGEAFYELGRPVPRVLPPASRNDLQDFTPAKRQAVLDVTEPTAFSVGDLTVALTLTERKKFIYSPFGPPTFPNLVKPGYFNQTNPSSVGQSPTVIKVN